MSKGKIIVFDKDNKEHLSMLNNYLVNNKQQINIDDILDINDNNSNELNAYLFYEENKNIKDIFQVNILKDIKMCTITLPTNNTSLKKRIDSLTDYILTTFDIKELFIKISKENNQLKEFLTEQGYEDLGEEDNHMLLLKEQYDDIKKTYNSL